MKLVVFLYFTWIFIVNNSHSITLSEKMKTILQEATEKFESERNNAATISCLILRPVTITTNGRLLHDTSALLSWNMYITFSYLLWDPLTQYQTIMQASGQLNCPLCSDRSKCVLSRSGEWYNGRISRLNPRVIFDSHTPLLLVSAVYKCDYGHEVAGCHPAVLQVLRNVDIPFFLTHKHGFTLELANFVEELVDNGLSFDKVEGIIRKQYKSVHDRFEASFWRDLRLSKLHGNSISDRDAFFPKFSSEYFPTPSADLLTDIYLKRFVKNEHLYKKSMNDINARWISCDHTFKSACNIGYKRSEDGKWVNQYKSIFCVLNEKGEVINWQFTSSESFDELKDMFIDIKKKFERVPLQFICIDNCCKWKDMLQVIFPTALIKQDLFHAVQRFCKTLKKKNIFRHELSVDYGRIFRHPADNGDTRKMNTPNETTIVDNLNQFLTKWKDRQSNGVNVLGKKQLSAIDKIRTHILKGCLSDIPVHCSTSMNERLHKDMKKLLSKNRMGVQLAYAKFSRFFFWHNQERGNKDSVDSMQALQYKDMYNGIATKELKDVDDVCFGIRSKYGSNNINEKSIINLNDMTSEKLNEYSVLIDNALELEKNQFTSSEEDMSGAFDWLQSIDSLVSILKRAFAIFKTILQVKGMWSSKPINLLKIPFSAQKYKLDDPPPSGSQDSVTTRIMNERERLETISNSFGFSIVSIRGDGNCFFTSVAFELLQVLSTAECPPEQRLFLESLGVTADVNVDTLSHILRNLLVDEWLNNRNEYYSFFQNIDLETEAARFRQSGEFSGALGDALPLGMANLLNMPILIITAVHNMPIVSVVPRTYFSHESVIYLSYIQEGVGHYDALISNPTPGSHDQAFCGNLNNNPAGTQIGISL